MTILTFADYSDSSSLAAAYQVLWSRVAKEEGWNTLALMRRVMPLSTPTLTLTLTPTLTLTLTRGAMRLCAWHGRTSVSLQHRRQRRRQHRRQ